MKAHDDLLAAWNRFNAGLAVLDASPPPGPARARSLRESVTRHLNGFADNAEGRLVKCELHPSMLAFNCAACKSERDGRPAHEHRHPASYPETPEAARVVDARVLGELYESGREHRV